MNASNQARNESALRDACFAADAFTGLSKEAALTKAMKCSSDIEDFVDKYNLNPNKQNGFISKKVYDLYHSVNRAIIQGQGLEVPGADQPPAKFIKILELLKPAPTALQSYVRSILPALDEAGGNASFTLSVGPGSEIYQYYPHDEEFVDTIYKEKTVNVVMVIEGGTESTFGNNYITLFQEGGNAWKDALLRDMEETFSVAGPLTIAILDPKLATVQFSFNGGANQMYFIFYLGDYVKGIIDPLVHEIIFNTSFNLLLCGIRNTPCTNLFFKETPLYYNNFHYYSFLHGIWNTKRIKNQLTSIGINIQRLRNARFGKENLVRSLERTEEDTESTGYPTSKLCKSRVPNKNDPYCVQGKTNAALFWRHLGGKRRKQTKRMKRKGRKTRKH